MPVGTSGMKDKTVAALVASTGTGPLMHGRQHMRRILLLDRQGIIHGGGLTRDGVSATLATRLAALGRGGHGSMEGGELMHHALVLLLLIGMHGLSVLTKVVESRELFATVASERTFSGMFPNVPREMFAPAEDHSALAIAPALESFRGSGTIASVYASGRSRRG